jgi:hypothetical protein
MVEKWKKSKEELTECRQSQRLFVASGRNPNRHLITNELLATSDILAFLDTLRL